MAHDLKFCTEILLSEQLAFLGSWSIGVDRDTAVGMLWALQAVSAMKSGALSLYRRIIGGFSF
ncbi:hypothetical protein NG791_06020 [Laspinema sp. D1]|uniref:hypothetical protein n=1 Tax=Laspinema palackyanum TaxID=3231601 RepID=UPI0034721D4A|nr:hypothetical protein [Laspinema sp. D2b]